MRRTTTASDARPALGQAAKALLPLDLVLARHLGNNEMTGGRRDSIERDVFFLSEVVHFWHARTHATTLALITAD